MVLDALEDAGLTLADVDGVCHPESAVAFAEYLGLHPTFIESTMTGGSSYEVHVEHAAAAIAAGLCDVVVSVYAATPRSDRTRRRRATAARHAPGPTRWPSGSCPSACACRWAPTRWPPPATCTSSARRPSSWPQIAVSTREWAALNPRARYRDPITVDDVLASPLQVSPLHLLDCCLVTDGAGAFVMTSAARARSLRKPPVYVLGAATCTDHMGITQMPDLTTTPGVGLGRPRLRHGRPRPGRRGRAHGLRQLHHHRPPPPRGPRLLRQGRGWPVRRRGRPRARAARSP